MQRNTVNDNGKVRDLISGEVLGWVAVPAADSDDAWADRAAHLIYDDHVILRGLGGILCPSWSGLTDAGKEHWLKLATRIEHIERELT